jgi:hypothetical protein
MNALLPDGTKGVTSCALDTDGKATVGSRPIHSHAASNLLVLIMTPSLLAIIGSTTSFFISSLAARRKGPAALLEHGRALLI